MFTNPRHQAPRVKAALRPASAEQLEKRSYATPQVVALGRLVSLVQGGSQGRRRDLYEGRYSIG